MAAQATLPVRRLIILSLALLIILLTLGFPATAIWRQFEDRAQGLELIGVSGTLWRGRADQIRWQHAPLGELYWHWIPGWPLRWEVSVQGPLVNLQAQLQPRAGELNLSQIQARWPAILMRSPLAEATLEGEFRAQLSELQWLGEEPHRIVGQIDWYNARLSAPVVADLGQVRINLETPQDGLIALQVRTQAGGNLQMLGSGQVQQGQYQLNLHLRSLNINSNFNQWLGLLGEPTADGGVRVSLNGSLRPGVQP